MGASRDAGHAFLVERIGKNVDTWHAVTGFGQQSLNTAGRVKFEIVAVGAAKDLVDLGLKGAVDRILGFFDDRIDHHEAPARLQNPHHFSDDTGGVTEMVQAKRNEGAIEGAGLIRQFVSLAGGLIIGRYGVGMVMANVEHRQRLINTENPAALERLGQRPGDTTGTRGKVEDRFATFERQRFDQLLGQIGADIRQAPAVKFRRMSRIVEARFLAMIVPVGVPMSVIVLVFVIMTVAVIMFMIAVPMRLVTVRMLLVVAVAMFVPMPMSFLFMIMAVLAAMRFMRMFMIVIVLMIAFVFVFMFVRHMDSRFWLAYCCRLPNASRLFALGDFFHNLPLLVGDFHDR
jgi:hypothetical protein